ncbi:F-box protein [Apiospora phragmitis]|uniref:Glycerophosphocholine acyltransferase 1 n=1 Tax=Apiospora phragmitis TaxID=2905665 RepID=A0ABR1UIW4_9PEZI
MADMGSVPTPIPGAKSDAGLTDGDTAATSDGAGTPPLDASLSEPATAFSVLDLLDNFALPQQLEKIQRGISAQREKVHKSRAALKSRSQGAKERMVEEWRRRSVEKLGNQWNDTKVITLREKVSFICAVMNIFISGYLIGGYPEYFHIWYTAQLAYFMPIRYFTYHRRGYHYFLADLCYFVNLLLFFSIWVFPSSKRLFTAAYCLAFGNNAVAIILWRNSLVFHSFDKVTSLFIHIMPCATLHCIVHLLPPELQQAKFPAVWAVKTAPTGSATAYANVISMLAWSTVPYLLWQLAYYFLITVRRREKIAAGRPTSYTWLRKSYAKTWIGKIVLALPDALQEPAFMFVQYCYAPLGSGTFLVVVFSWSIYNGSTFYIDVFGKRFQKELESMKAEPPPLDKRDHAAKDGTVRAVDPATGKSMDVDEIPMLNDEKPRSADANREFDVTSTAIDTDSGARDVARERKSHVAST